MKKKDLQEAAHVTSYQMKKLARDENVTTEIVGNIEAALEDLEDKLPSDEDEKA